MEYVQMTLNDWISLKKEITEEFTKASASFVRIGYLLRKAEESEGYKNDGYDTLTEWAQAELGITGTYVSRFKAINARYSVGGYSDRLQDQYVGYGSAKLGEMLALPDADMEMVTPQTKREDILKYHALGNLTGKKCAEVLNPGGSRMVRTKAAVIAMKDDGMIVKTFGPDGGRQEVSWQDFADRLCQHIDAGAVKAPARESAPKQQEEKREPQETGAAKAQRIDAENRPGRSEDRANSPAEPVPAEAMKDAPAEGASPIAPAQFAGPPEQEGLDPEEEESVPKEPGPSVPDEKMEEYIRALADARGKLEEIEKSFGDADWHRLSDQLIQLGFIVNQLKVLTTMKEP